MIPVVIKVDEVTLGGLKIETVSVSQDMHVLTTISGDLSLLLTGIQAISRSNC